MHLFENNFIALISWLPRFTLEGIGVYIQSVVPSV